MPLLADLVCRSNFSYPTAIEIARQMTAGVGSGSATKLVAAGVGVQSATELAKQINAGAFDSHKLALAGFPTSQAVALKKHSGI